MFGLLFESLMFDALLLGGVAKAASAVATTSLAAKAAFLEWQLSNRISFSADEAAMAAGVPARELRLLPVKFNGETFVISRVESRVLFIFEGEKAVGISTSPEAVIVREASDRRKESLFISISLGL